MTIWSELDSLLVLIGKLLVGNQLEQLLLLKPGASGTREIIHGDGVAGFD